MVSIVALFCLGGYILYKMGEAENTEEGAGMLGACIASVALAVLHFLPKIFRTLFRFLYEGWTGHDLPEKLVHAERILSNAEVLELVQKFKNSPYIVPSVENYIQNNLGILWLDIKAVGLIPLYQGLTRIDICGMAESIIQNFYMETRGIRVKVFIKVASPIIQNFYMETRGIRVKVFIKVASPKRLYFAIPLSVEGEKYLEKQVEDQPQIQDSYEDVTFDLFEEEIPENEWKGKNIWKNR